MHRRLVPSVLLALACALLIGAAAPVAGALTPNAQTKQNLRLLQVYVERYAAGKRFIYPAVSVVKKGGGLTAPVWPVNPWTGAAMAPGRGRGAYAYTPGPDGGSYTLAARLSSGFYTLTGDVPGWLIEERAAEGDAAARDAATKNGLMTIYGLVRSVAQGLGALPSVATIANGGTSFPDWPVSPYTGTAMTVGTEPGQFAYAPAADGSWTLVAHLTTGDFTRTSPAFDWDAQKDLLTIQGVTFISYGLELDAVLNNGLYPSELAKDGLMTVDPWPKNGFTGAWMADSAAKGDYDYAASVNGSDYDLVANLTDGGTYDVAAWTQPLFEPLWRLRVSLKDMAAQGYAQVLKDYVDEWKLEHSGELPAAQQMSPTGAVGAVHTWWPKNPWTMAPMAAGTSTGDFEYTQGAGGAFTIVLHQQPLPMVNGQAGTEFPETYTAQ